MRMLFSAIALFALVSCGPAAPTGQTTSTASTRPAQTAQPGAVSFDAFRNLPDWLFILRTNEGGTIHYNQRTVTRQNGFADIWLQVHWGNEQLYQIDAANRQTIIHYTVEREHYRFNCTDSTFTIVERQILGANEQIVAHDEPRQIFRAIPDAGAAHYVLPIACHGS